MKIISNIEISEEEKNKYVEYLKNKEEKFDSIETVNLNFNDDKVSIEYDIKATKFERIRRITGYLAGTTDRWNNAKQSEEKDRVKHEK